MEYLEEITKQKSQSHIQEKDEHETFFDSLLSIVRQFDEDQSLTCGPTYSSVQYQQPGPHQRYELPRYFQPTQNFNLPSSAPFFCYIISIASIFSTK